MRFFKQVNQTHWLNWYMVGAIGLVLWIFVIYSNSFNGALVLDDRNVVKPGILVNLKDLSNPAKLIRPRILTNVSFALNYKVHQDKVFGYHVVSFSIHVVVALLLLLFIHLLFKTPALNTNQAQQFKRVVPLTAAFIFASHPIQTMAVSYITQRYISLTTLWYLISLIFYLVCRQAWLTHRKIYAYLMFFLMIFTGYLAFLSKEVAVTLPLMVVMIEWLLYQKSKITWRAMVTTISAFIVMAIMSVFGYLRYSSFIFKTQENTNGQMVNSLNYAATQFKVLLVYLLKIFMPLGLNADHYIPLVQGPFDIFMYVGILVWLSMWAALWYFRTRKPLVSFGFAWILITPLISSGVIPIIDVSNEYRLYLPMIGYSLLAAYGIWMTLKKQPVIASVIVSLLVILYGAFTFNRNFVYQSAERFWGDVIKKSPNKARGYVNYAVELHQDKNAAGAIAAYERALEIDPDRLTALANLGVLYTQLAQYEKATSYFEKALQIDENYVDALNGQGVIYMNLGNFPKAEAYFSKILAHDPTHKTALENLKLLGKKRDQ